MSENIIQVKKKGFVCFEEQIFGVHHILENWDFFCGIENISSVNMDLWLFYVIE